jgi:hypothetical protein
MVGHLSKKPKLSFVDDPGKLYSKGDMQHKLKDWKP